MSLSTKEGTHTLCTYTSMYTTKDKACTFDNITAYQTKFDQQCLILQQSTLVVNSKLKQNVKYIMEKK